MIKQTPLDLGGYYHNEYFVQSLNDFNSAIKYCYFTQLIVYPNSNTTYLIDYLCNLGYTMNDYRSIDEINTSPEKYIFFIDMDKLVLNSHYNVCRFYEETEIDLDDELPYVFSIHSDTLKLYILQEDII